MQLCLFDIDGTLLNTGGAGQAAMEAAIREEFGSTAAMLDIPFAGRTDRAIIQDIFGHFAIHLTEAARERFLAAYLRNLPKCLADTPGLVLPGVVELLSKLHGRAAITLGLLTGNFLAGAKCKLEHYGLADYFDFALGGFGDSHLDRDDVARTALAAAQQQRPAVDFQLKNVWVIGDTPADVRCGRAIGARVLAVATGIYPAAELAAAQPDHLVTDFQDAETILRLWS